MRSTNALTCSLAMTLLLVPIHAEQKPSSYNWIQLAQCQRDGSKDEILTQGSVLVTFSPESFGFSVFLS